jgi:branched-chain amino acid transport system permease protein
VDNRRRSSKLQPALLYAKHKATIAALVFFLLLFPAVLSNRYYIGVMTDAGIYTIIAIGLNLLMGYAGQISLGHAGFFGIGAYCSGLLNVKLGLSPWITTIAAVVFTAGTAYLVGIPTLRLRGHYLAMATLGFGEVIFVVLSKLDWLTGDTSGLPGIKPFSIWRLQFSSDFFIGQYCLVWVIALVILILSLNITKSRVGRAFRAIHGSEIAASGMGVDIAKYKVQVFVLSAVYAAIAGCMYAHFRWFIGYPTFRLQTSIRLVTMVVAGGLGNIWGAVLGAMLLTWLPELLTVAAEYDIMVYGILLMGVMIFMPDGLVGRFSALIGRITSGASSDMQMEEGG